MILNITTELHTNKGTVTVTIITGCEITDSPLAPLDLNEPVTGWEWSSGTGEWWRYAWDTTEHFWKRTR